MPRPTKKPEDYWRTNKRVTGVGPEDRGLMTGFVKNSVVRCPNGHLIRVRTHLVLNHHNDIVALHCPQCRRNGKLSHFGSYQIK